jgi:hypothetical protein
MQPGFSPRRQGAAHALGEGDVVILRATPEFHRDTGLRDTRIRISRNGYAERALWVHLPAHVNEPGLQTEFHLWSHRLDEPTIARIDEALRSLGRALPATTPDPNPESRSRELRFWLGGRPMTLAVSVPADPRVTPEQLATFDAAWALIHATVSAGP